MEGSDVLSRAARGDFDESMLRAMRAAPDAVLTATLENVHEPADLRAVADAEFLIALGATSVSRIGPMRAGERGRNGFVTQVALTREQLQDLRDVADKLLTRPA